MRILITGPECTGKSTLAAALSQALSIPWFPEYARTFLEEQGPAYDQATILSIAQQHAQLVQTFPPDQPLILDTYLLNLKIWSQYKYGSCDKWIAKQLVDLPPFDLVFLTAADLAWQQDGLRENEANAAELFSLFQKEMKQLDWDYIPIKGQGSARLQSALNAISRLSL